MVLARLLQVYPTVLRPFGENQRYDLLIEDHEGNFIRVQCKTGRLRRVYLVPVDEVGTRECFLRIEPTKNAQAKKVRWAKDYELRSPG